MNGDDCLVYGVSLVVRNEWKTIDGRHFPTQDHEPNHNFINNGTDFFDARRHKVRHNTLNDLRSK